ncbi:hypothetical protein AURDEDRAFT_79920 [Auricularia subglabra TFB-10046 SS5]|nr:hypothetical protein AURDEDRAFT_79920 [Auricularia subglabra TFB-10046 SS5]
MDVDDEDEAPALSDPTLVDLAAALERADTLVFVLDARDPLAYRSTTIEALDKKKVFVLTKTDLAPRESVAAWAASLRETLSAPVILFRAASGFQPAPAPAQSKGKQKATPTSEGDALGVDTLLSALSSVGAKTAAVVGQSNVGKSALVNSLAHTSASQIYDLATSKPGPSTTGRPVSVAVGELTLLDTAGYSPLYADVDSEEDERARDILLRSRGRIDRVKDPLPAVNALIPRAPAEDLMLLYNLPAFPSGSTTAFLTAVARARNCLGKDGLPDHINAARIVLRDWNTGAFAWYTHPSESPATGTPTPDDSKVLDACLPRKELRRAKGSLVRLAPGAPDARQIDTHAVLASSALEHGESEVRARAPKRVRISTDEDEDNEEDAEMTDGEEEEEDEDDDEEMEDKSGYESDNNDEPAPATSKKAKRKEAAAEPKKKVAFASVASYKKIKAGPTRVANAGGAKKAAPANGQAYDFGKFFK